jgi:hypothetical protein
MMIKRYSTMVQLEKFLDRYEYLKLSGTIGEETFGYDRYINQKLYRSKEWRDIRHKVIVRDEACDLAHLDFPIHGKIIIHHINPITLSDIEDANPKVFDLNNLVCVSMNTHNAIHYGDEELLPHDPVERTPFDTCPWRL